MKALPIFYKQKTYWKETFGLLSVQMPTVRINQTLKASKSRVINVVLAINLTKTMLKEVSDKKRSLTPTLGYQFLRIADH